MRLAQTLQIEFAFPTQTIYMGRETESVPVFPEHGDIHESTEKEIEFAIDQARIIAVSEMGGENVVPGPYKFKQKQ